MISLLTGNLENCLKLGTVGIILIFIYKVYSWYQTLKRRESELVIKDTEVKLDAVQNNYKSANLLDVLNNANKRMQGRRDKADPKK